MISCSSGGSIALNRGWALAFCVAGLLPFQSVAASPPRQSDGSAAWLRYALTGTRQANHVYWQVDSGGKGEISVPAVIGYDPPQPLANDPAYRIAPGVHRFDIGEDGYREIRAFLGPVIDQRRDPKAALTDTFTCHSADDSGSIMVSWSDAGGGQFQLANDCLTPFGTALHDRMDQTWFILARRLHAKGYAGVSVVEPEPLPVPNLIAVTQTGIWTPYTLSWEVDATGKGWIERIPPAGLDGWSGPYPYQRRAGFQLDNAFHQAIIRTLAPYIGGTTQSGACEDEITTSDQPNVAISSTGADGARHMYRSDLGCPSFAARVQRVNQMFQVLVNEGSLGGARMLFGVD